MASVFNKIMTAVKFPLWLQPGFFKHKFSLVINKDYPSFADCTMIICRGNIFSFSKGSVIPYKVEVPRPAVVAAVGSDVELKCFFSGSPIPQVIWYKDGNKVTDLGFQFVRGVGSRFEAILELSNVTSSVSGHFVCVVSGVAGTAEGNITLFVGGMFVSYHKTIK